MPGRPAISRCRKPPGLAFGSDGAADHQGDGSAGRNLAAAARCGRLPAVDLLSRRQGARRRARPADAQTADPADQAQTEEESWRNSTDRGLRHARGTARQLVVFLHGYGADGNDLIEIGRAWQQLLPDAAFVSPHAPEPCAQAPVGRQWFSLTFRDPDERWLGVTKAGPVLERFLDAELARRNLPPSALALVGFQPGHHDGAARRPAPRRSRRRRSSAIPACWCCPMTGRRRRSPTRSDRARRCCWCTAIGDELIPVQALFLSAQGLAALEVPVEWHMSAGIGHGIDDEGLRHGGEFLAQPLPALRSA